MVMFRPRGSLVRISTTLADDIIVTNVETDGSKGEASKNLESKNILKIEHTTSSHLSATSVRMNENSIEGSSTTSAANKTEKIIDSTTIQIIPPPQASYSSADSTSRVLTKVTADDYHAENYLSKTSKEDLNSLPVNSTNTETNNSDLLRVPPTSIATPLLAKQLTGPLPAISNEAQRVAQETAVKAFVAMLREQKAALLQQRANNNQSNQQTAPNTSTKLAGEGTISIGTSLANQRDIERSYFELLQRNISSNNPANMTNNTPIFTNFSINDCYNNDDEEEMTDDEDEYDINDDIQTSFLLNSQTSTQRDSLTKHIVEENFGVHEALHDEQGSVLLYPKFSCPQSEDRLKYPNNLTNYNSQSNPSQHGHQTTSTIMISHQNQNHTTAQQPLHVTITLPQQNMTQQVFAIQNLNSHNTSNLRHSFGNSSIASTNDPNTEASYARNSYLENLVEAAGRAREIGDPRVQEVISIHAKKYFERLMQGRIDGPTSELTSTITAEMVTSYISGAQQEVTGTSVCVSNANLTSNSSKIVDLNNRNLTVNSRSLLPVPHPSSNTHNSPRALESEQLVVLEKIRGTSPDEVVGRDEINDILNGTAMCNDNNADSTTLSDSSKQIVTGSNVVTHPMSQSLHIHHDDDRTVHDTANDGQSETLALPLLSGYEKAVAVNGRHSDLNSGIVSHNSNETSEDLGIVNGKFVLLKKNKKTALLTFLLACFVITSVLLTVCLREKSTAGNVYPEMGKDATNLESSSHKLTNNHKSSNTNSTSTSLRNSTQPGKSTSVNNTNGTSQKSASPENTPCCSTCSTGTKNALIGTAVALVVIPAIAVPTSIFCCDAGAQEPERKDARENVGAGGTGRGDGVDVSDHEDDHDDNRSDHAHDDHNSEKIISSGKTTSRSTTALNSSVTRAPLVGPGDTSSATTHLGANASAAKADHEGEAGEELTKEDESQKVEDASKESDTKSESTPKTDGKKHWPSTNSNVSMEARLKAARALHGPGERTVKDVRDINSNMQGTNQIQVQISTHGRYSTDCMVPASGAEVAAASETSAEDRHGQSAISALQTVHGAGSEDHATTVYLDQLLQKQELTKAKQNVSELMNTRPVSDEGVEVGFSTEEAAAFANSNKGDDSVSEIDSDETDVSAVAEVDSTSPVDRVITSTGSTSANRVLAARVQEIKAAAKTSAGNGKRGAKGDDMFLRGDDVFSLKDTSNPLANPDALIALSASMATKRQKGESGVENQVGSNPSTVTQVLTHPVPCSLSDCKSASEYDEKSKIDLLTEAFGALVQEVAGGRTLTEAAKSILSGDSSTRDGVLGRMLFGTGIGKCRESSNRDLLVKDLVTVLARETTPAGSSHSVQGPERWSLQYMQDSNFCRLLVPPGPEGESVREDCSQFNGEWLESVFKSTGDGTKPCAVQGKVLGKAKNMCKVFPRSKEGQISGAEDLEKEEEDLTVCQKKRILGAEDIDGLLEFGDEESLSSSSTSSEETDKDSEAQQPPKSANISKEPKNLLQPTKDAFKAYKCTTNTTYCLTYTAGKMAEAPAAEAPPGPFHPPSTQAPEVAQNSQSGAGNHDTKGIGMMYLTAPDWNGRLGIAPENAGTTGEIHKYQVLQGGKAGNGAPV